LTCQGRTSILVISMMNHVKILLLLCVLFSSGCASFRSAGQIERGRHALIAGSTDEALTLFEEVARNNPDYVYTYRLFRESIWTYLGRAQYAKGMPEQARRSFERALSVLPDDYLARLYLGLVSARTGDRSRALKEFESAMKGLYEFLEYANYSGPFEFRWDPAREIRSELERNLAMIQGKDVDWDKLISSAEWIGRRMEQEIDYVRRDEERQLERRERDRSGVSLGVGFGF
jgi:tetratricopeptide (TPR) repeat protein